MNLFTLSTGNKASSDGNFDLGGSDFSVIPANTVATALIDEACWDEYEGERFIKIRWAIIGGEYNSRKIFQKLKVYDNDVKKADKARMMLAAIDANCGGKLAQIEHEFTPAELSMALLRTPMMIVIDVWEFNGKEGNWIRKVERRQRDEQPKQFARQDSGICDDIPF